MAKDHDVPQAPQDEAQVTDWLKDFSSWLQKGYGEEQHVPVEEEFDAHVSRTALAFLLDGENANRPGEAGWVPNPFDPNAEDADASYPDEYYDDYYEYEDEDYDDYEDYDEDQGQVYEETPAQEEWVEPVAELGPEDAPPQEEAAKEPNQVRSRLVRLALVLVVATVLAPSLTAFSPANAFAVASGSMEPELKKGDLAVAVPGEIKVDDVVVYWSPTGAHQVHRVIGIEERGGTTYYTTKGDNNDATDSFAVPESDVIGKVKFHVPYLGHLWIIPTHIQVIAFTTLLVLYLAITAWDAGYIHFKREAYRSTPTDALS